MRPSLHVRRITTFSAALMLALIAPFNVHAGEVVGIVTHLVVRSSDGLIYVDVGAAPSMRPTCAANTTYWMIANENTETGKKLYALLLAAQLSGRPVRIVGSGTCTRWGDGEDIHFVQIS